MGVATEFVLLWMKATVKYKHDPVNDVPQPFCFKAE